MKGGCFLLRRFWWCFPALGYNTKATCGSPLLLDLLSFWVSCCFLFSLCELCQVQLRQVATGTAITRHLQPTWNSSLLSQSLPGQVVDGFFAQLAVPYSLHPCGIHRCTVPVAGRAHCLGMLPSLPRMPGLLKFLLFMLSDTVLCHYTFSVHFWTGCLMIFFSLTSPEFFDCCICSVWIQTWERQRNKCYGMIRQRYTSGFAWLMDLHCTLLTGSFPVSFCKTR